MILPGLDSLCRGFDETYRAWLVESGFYQGAGVVRVDVPWIGRILTVAAYGKGPAARKTESECSPAGERLLLKEMGVRSGIRTSPT
jgi:hypothetical protein